MVPGISLLKGVRPAWVGFLTSALTCSAATYYVATDGDDGNPGTGPLPWRTIQQAANVILPGDTVLVRQGHYDERVVTSRGGSAPNGRVTFEAEGAVVVRGWVINHPYLTVRGFQITGHSGTSTQDAHLQLNRDGDFFELDGCIVRDGIQLVRADFVFDAGDASISTSTGGFVDARFAVGQSVYIGRAAGGEALNAGNSGVRTITSVTDNRLTVSGALVDQGPASAYLSASYNYGLSMHSGTEHCLFRNNTFQSLGFDTWFINGRGHRFEHNRIEQSNGWDAMHFGGSDHVFFGNVIRNSPLVVHQISPDAMENYPPAPYFNVVFTNNFVFGFVGVLASQKGQNTMSGLRITHNVFVDVGRFSLTHPDTVLEHNTFLRVAKEASAVHSRAAHPVFVATSVGATNVTLRNNVFVDCGQPTSNQPLPVVGWYEISGPSDSIVREGNFVAGPPPEFGAKTGWLEDPDLNGGDPGFVNITDPLGPDGIPFTDDDGLRLRPDSRLRGAGVGGRDIGAYVDIVALPSLEIAVLDNSVVRLSWPASAVGYELETAFSLDGPWGPSGVDAELEGSEWVAILELPAAARFYRLTK
jgi:hypothetical protein